MGLVGGLDEGRVENGDLEWERRVEGIRILCDCDVRGGGCLRWVF